jgi:hypothetical protein
MVLSTSNFHMDDIDILPDIDSLCRSSKKKMSVTFSEESPEDYIQLSSMASPNSYEDVSSCNSSFIWNTAEALMSAGKIDTHLSPSDNAIKLLTSALALNMEESARLAIVYALGVLKSDSACASVPVGLQMRKSGTDSNSRGSVMHWLTTSYTPFKHDDAPKHKVGLRNVAAGIRFAVRMRESNARSHLPEEYVFDAQPAERAAISAALVGVDEWGWDIEPLRVASGGRPLQTLGWHLLHQWGVGPCPSRVVLCLPPFSLSPS